MFENFRNIIGVLNIYRSNEFDLLNEEEYQYLIKRVEKDIKVIDLRGCSFENFSDIRKCIITIPIEMLTLNLYSLYYKNSSWVDKILFYFYNDKKYFLTNTLVRRGIIAMYMDFLEADKIEILKIFKLLLHNREGIIIINCKYGKDRTGLICMLIMLLCGIDDETIISEYSESFTNLDKDGNRLEMIKDMNLCGL
ncbi:2368_t:CDS:1, partial [Cetraspora pellucida]